MSKELTQIVRRIQFLKDWTVEQVAASIGYSRVHLTREMGKEGKSDLTDQLKAAHRDLLQKDTSKNDSKAHREPEISERLDKVIQEIKEWQVTIDSTLDVLIQEFAPLIAEKRGKSVAGVFSELKSDIDSRIKQRIGALKNAG